MNYNNFLSERIKILEASLPTFNIVVNEDGIIQDQNFAKFIEYMSRDNITSYKADGLQGPKCNIIIDFSAVSKFNEDEFINQLREIDELRWSAPGEYETAHGYISAANSQIDWKSKKCEMNIVWDFEL